MFSAEFSGVPSRGLKWKKNIKAKRYIFVRYASFTVTSKNNSLNSNLSPGVSLASSPWSEREEERSWEQGWQAASISQCRQTFNRERKRGKSVAGEQKGQWQLTMGAGRD